MNTPKSSSFSRVRHIIDHKTFISSLSCDHLILTHAFLDIVQGITGNNIYVDLEELDLLLSSEIRKALK